MMTPIMIQPAVMTVFVILTNIRNGILALGTVRRNRIPNSKMPVQNDMKSIGDSIEMMTTFEEVEVSCVAWLDNMQVMLMSSFALRILLSDISRYGRKIK